MYNSVLCLFLQKFVHKRSKIFWEVDSFLECSNLSTNFSPMTLKKRKKYLPLKNMYRGADLFSRKEKVIMKFINFRIDFMWMAFVCPCDKQLFETVYVFRRHHKYGIHNTFIGSSFALTFLTVHHKSIYIYLTECNVNKMFDRFCRVNGKR